MTDTTGNQQFTELFIERHFLHAATISAITLLALTVTKFGSLALPLAGFATTAGTLMWMGAELSESDGPINGTSVIALSYAFCFLAIPAGTIVAGLPRNTAVATMLVLLFAQMFFLKITEILIALVPYVKTDLAEIWAAFQN